MDQLDDDLAVWRRLVVEVTAAAERVRADPTSAIELGMQVGPASTEEPEFARWLRAAAQQLIPAKFEWTIATAIGGRCWLVLKTIKETG